VSLTITAEHYTLAGVTITIERVLTVLDTAQQFVILTRNQNSLRVLRDITSNELVVAASSMANPHTYHDTHTLIVEVKVRPDHEHGFAALPVPAVLNAIDAEQFGCPTELWLRPLWLRPLRHCVAIAPASSDLLPVLRDAAA
jgi:hypothetical protein